MRKIGFSSELWRSACRETAWRAQAGALLHPVAAAGVGLGAGLHRSAPGLFSILVTLILLIAVGRLILIRRFDPICGGGSGMSASSADCW